MINLKCGGWHGTLDLGGVSARCSALERQAMILTSDCLLD